MRAIVNPFTRDVTIVDRDFSEVTLFFAELDEWKSCELNGRSLFTHFYYDDVFKFEVFAYDEDGEVEFENDLITKISIEY
jgi:hypothetical protein